MRIWLILPLLLFSSDDAEGGAALFQVEVLDRVVAEQHAAHLRGVVLAEAALLDLLAEHAGDLAAGHDGVGVGALDEDVVAAEAVDLVGRHRVEHVRERAAPGGGVDDPHPAEVDRHVGEVLGQRRQLFLVGVGDVVDVELRLGVLQEQVGHQRGAAVGDEVAVALLQAGVELHAQAVLAALAAEVVQDEVLQGLDLPAVRAVVEGQQAVERLLHRALGTSSQNRVRS